MQVFDFGIAGSGVSGSTFAETQSEMPVFECVWLGLLDEKAHFPNMVKSRLKIDPKVDCKTVETKSLYKIPEAYEYLQCAISIDALYAIARLKLVPVLRCGRGPFQYPQASLDRLASGEVDLSAIVSRRNLQRQRR